MTGKPSPKNAVEVLNKGADAYIMKPLDMENVLAIQGDQMSKQKEQKDTMVRLLETGRIRACIELIGRENTEAPDVR